MAITATIASQTKDELQIIQTINFSNGKQLTFKANDPAGIKLAIQNQIDQYEKIAAFTPAAPGTPVDLSKPVTPVTPPTQAEIDQAAFMNQFNAYLHIKAALKVSLVAQKTHDDALVALQANMKPEYVQLIPFTILGL